LFRAPEVIAVPDLGILLLGHSPIYQLIYPLTSSARPPRALHMTVVMICRRTAVR
jgi:hypothetical protein